MIIQTKFIAAAVFMSLFAAYQIFSLIRYVTKTNRDLTRLLESIKYSDFSQSFTNSLKGSGFEELHTAFTEVIKEFQRAKIEKEEHFRFLQTIVDHVGIALIAYNPDGAVEVINNAAKKLLKVPRLGNIRDLQSISPILTQKLLELSPGRKELVKLQQGDELLQLSIYATGFVLRKQQMILVAMQNIQSELEEKEMKSWQTLIRVLTHEIMNSITPIASLSATAFGLLKNNQECEVPDSLNEVIVDVRDAVNTIEKRSKGLLDFIENYRQLTRIPKPEFKIVQVKHLFERVGNLMKDQLDSQAIDFKMRVDPETLEITADQTLIEQVMINICKNSVEAVDGINNPKIEISAGTDGFGNPVVKVIDNGKGISEEVAEKIFIPFFTTKPQGSGIGLSLSRQIMRLHKGTLSVTSKPNAETTFVLRF
jgi:nitrogen fixation/metabolism regulation signal transduction histidine kinase